MTFTVRRLAYGLGAEVSGVDVSEEISEETAAALRSTWLDNQVLVFPNQHLDNAAHVAFSRHFGEPEVHFSKLAEGSGDAEDPEADAYVVNISNKTIDGKASGHADAGRGWHSDGAFNVRPPSGSLLYCKERPSVGGTTWFANMYMAYDSLSEGMRKLIDPLEVVNDLSVSPLSQYSYVRDPDAAEKVRSLVPPVIQPLVAIHPETRKKSLFLNEIVTRRINGMSEEESAGLLGYLFKHSVRNEFIYRHDWSVGDLVMWDNGSTMHLAPRDYDLTEIRDMRRVVLAGSAPSGRVLESAR